jgi:hypothetical protein
MEEKNKSGLFGCGTIASQIKNDDGGSSGPNPNAVGNFLLMLLLPAMGIFRMRTFAGAGTA